MPFDPEDVLGTDPGKGQKPAPGFDPSDVKATTTKFGQELIGGTLDPSTNFNEFRFQPKTNADNYLLRAQDQGFWESLGKTVGNVVSNIPLDIVQGVGYLGTLFEMGDDRDYNNALTEAIEKMKSPFGEVYREHPEKVWDPADSAWWMNNLGQLVESASSFAIEGAGIAKLFGTIAKGAAWSARSAKIGSRVAQGLSAGTLTYMEGAMSGAKVFETAYNNNYMKFIGQGMNATEADEQAKYIASQAAAATVQIHTAMNIGLNLTMLAPLFRSPEQAIVNWWRRNGAPMAGESQAQWAARIATAAPEGMPLRKLLGLGMQGPARLGLEAFQEGLEEVNTQYAEHIGKAVGEGREQKDISRSLLDADRYFKEVLNEEGALNMALGALGGVAQTVVMDRVPVHKVIKYGPDGQPLMTEQGQVQTERISSHTMNDRMNRQYFDNIKDALSKDMNWFSEKNSEMEAALKNKDLATLTRTRADLMSVHNLRAISMGLGDVWTNQYQEIMALDNTQSLSEDLNPAIQELDRQIEEDRSAGDMEAANQKSAQRYELLKRQSDLQDVTEAMQRGFADSRNDNSYRERAQQAMQNLDYLTKLYQDMQDKFTSTPEMEQTGLAEHMFYRQANLYLHKQQLDMMEQDLIKLRARVDEMTLSSQDDILVRQAQEFLADKEVWDHTVKKLNNDISRMNEATRTGNEQVIRQLLDRYKIPATPGSGKKLIETLERRKKTLQDKADYTNKELNDTIAVWRETNPGKEVKDVLQKVSERPVLEDIYRQNKAYLQQGLTEYEAAREQLAKDNTYEGIQRFLKENKQPDTKKQLDKQHIEAYNQQLDREIAATLDAKQKQVATTKLDERILQVQNDLSAKQFQLQQLRRQTNNITGFFKNLSKRTTNKQLMQELESEMYELRYELTHLTQRRDALAGQAAQATAQSQNIFRTPAPVVQPVTTLEPGSTPGENITQTEDATAEFNEELPDFDFSQEIVPSFTTIEEGNPVFDRLVGGTEAGTTLRQFIQLRKASTIEFLVSGVKTMIQRTNLPMPTDQEFDQFISPYVNALKNTFLAQKPDAIQEYEALKSMLKPTVLTVLDILEGEFRQHGFSYDRTLQILNQQVKEGNLAKNLTGVIANQLKAYLETVQQSVTTQSENIPVAQPATTVSASEQQKKDALRAIMQATGEEVFIQGTLDGTFIGEGLLAMDNQGNVILTRFADSKEGLTKGGQITTPDELRRVAGTFAGNQVATSGIEGGLSAFDTSTGVVGKYAIPLQDMIRLIKEGSIVFAGLGNKEFVLSPHIAAQYLLPTTDVQSKEFNEQPNTYIQPVTDSEPTTFSNAALDLDIVQQEQKRFVGASNIEAVKANFNTHPYKEFDNGSQIRIVSDYTQLDPKLNTDVLLPGVINSGDAITLQIDENWAGEINYDTEMLQDEFGDQLRKADMFQNYLDATGKIEIRGTAQHPKGGHANVPIKVIHQKSGKVIGYIPRADWILARYPDTQNYRNVVDEYQDEDVTVTDNVARQYSRIIKLREAVVRAWNTDKSLTLTSTVSKRGTGHVMINREVNPNTGRTKLLNRSAKNMLPDPSLEIAIMKQGAAYVGAGITSQKKFGKIPGFLKNATSLPVVMLPSPDGTYVPAPLYTHRLGDNPGSLNTVVAAIEMYLRSAAGISTASDLKNLQRISEEVGFDLTVSGGLRDFIQQYFTYTQKFGEKDTVITPSEVQGAANPQFMFDIPDLLPGERAAFIKVGTSFSGEKPMYAQLVDGQLHPDFEQALRTGLANRFKNVIFAGKQLRGINSQGQFKAPTILKDGNVRIHTYQDYNEFVKANSTTYVYGLNKVGNQYVYMANPVVQLDYDQALRSAPVTASGTTLKEPASSDLPASSSLEEEYDDLADLFGNGMLSPTPSSVTPIPIPSEGEQVSLELLQNLRNLTPEAHRNTLSPEQVLRELLERGITVLAEGHNPFYIC